VLLEAAAAFRFQALVIIGDHKGRVGVGVSKGADVSAAVTKATEVAKKHFLTIPMHNNTYARRRRQSCGSKILILPAAPGTGLIAGGVVRTVLEVAGIENALSKSLGSANRINTAYAALDALAKMKPASQWVTVKNKLKTTTKKAAPAKRRLSNEI
jgi:small subunit ribosomal protein S5